MTKHTLTHSIRKIDGEYRATFRVDGKLYDQWTAFDTDRRSINGTIAATIAWFEATAADVCYVFVPENGRFECHHGAEQINEIVQAIESTMSRPVDVRPRLCIRADSSKPLDHPDNWEAGRVYTADELEENRRQSEAAALMEDARAFGFYGPFEGARS